MLCERRNITQPADWLAAIEAAAAADGVTVSEWIGEACRKRLPVSVRRENETQTEENEMKSTFKNTTEKGNVAAMRIEVTEQPHSHAGKAHARLVCVLRDGRETTRDGKYFPTMEEAQQQGRIWEAAAESAGLVEE